MPSVNKKYLFYYVAFFTLLAKILLAYRLPLTGDEAYFIIWGRFPAMGYYDHTPLLGWLLHAMLLLSDNLLWLRMPAIILSLLIAWGLVKVLKDFDRDKAYLTATIFLLSPIAVLFVLISTDVPLIFFTFFSVICLYFAIKKTDNLFYYFLSGLCLGLAFFSKYFAVLIALAYLIFYLIQPKTVKRTLGFAVVFLCVIPFGLLNAYWNYHHAWANIVFNVFSRNRAMKLQLESWFMYLFSLIYVMTPLLICYLAKKAKLLRNISYYPYFSLFATCLLCPFVFFLGLSLFKSIGFHWLFSFLPFLYFLLPIFLLKEELEVNVKFSFWFTFVQYLILIIFLLIPVHAWYAVLNEKQYTGIVYLMKHQQIRQFMHQYDSHFVVTSHSYADASIMFYDSNIYSPVFGYGSEHGRQDDFETNFKDYDSRDFLIFSSKPTEVSIYAPFFKKVQLNTFTYEGGKFYAVFGYQFNYAHYRDKIIREVNGFYWRIPNFLPHTPSFYCLKYLTPQECPAHHWLN